jgi:DNA polymerase III alpha subunit (gram-positive type)
MSTKTKAIVVQSAGSGFQIVIPAEAQKLKTDALATARKHTQVTNADEQTNAVQAASLLKGIAAEAEATRKAVKQPFWDAGKAIDARAAEFVLELEAEAKRLERLIANFQRAEADKAAAIIRKAEQERQAAEAAARRERERLAEIERQAAEASRKAQEAKTKKAREAAQAEAARLESERQQAEIDAMEAEDDAATAGATVVVEEAPQAKGASVSFVREFEVTDIDALYAFDLARRKTLAERNNLPLSTITPWIAMEPKKREIKDFINSLQDHQLDSIPGLVITNTAKAAVRGVSSTFHLG